MQFAVLGSKLNHLTFFSFLTWGKLLFLDSSTLHIIKQNKTNYSAVCKIVRRFLILVHKCQFPGYGWHPWILIPPIIFTNFSWAKYSNFFIMQNSKFTEIFKISWKHVPFILCRSSQFVQMLYISVNFDFCTMKKLWDLAHEKLVNILGGHHVGTNIHGCQP